MFEEEAPKKKKPVHVVGEDLATLSLAELDERIAILKAEIARIEESIAGKKASQSAADAFFKK
jgi:uncharacterized small protein (DUF1192 family)